jgi:hypothetical protein
MVAAPALGDVVEQPGEIQELGLARRLRISAASGKRACASGRTRPASSSITVSVCWSTV